MENIQLEITIYPSYLSTILGKDEKIILCTIIQKTSSTDDYDCTYSANDSVEYTGNPLQVDLNEEDFVVLNNINLKSWKPEENEQCPMPYDTALYAINKHNRALLLKKCNGTTNYPIFCVCDGNNGDKCVLLGAFYNVGKYIRRTRLLYKGLYLFNDINFDVEYLLQIHKENASNIGKNCVTRYEMSCLHDLLPFNCDATKQLHLKVKTNSYHSFDENESKLIIKVDVSSTSSKQHLLWKDLELLQNFISKTDNLDKVLSFCENGLSLKELHTKLTNFMKSYMLKRDPLELNDVIFATFLWDIVKGVQTFEDLQQFFDALFLNLFLQKDFICKVQEDNRTIFFSFIQKILQRKHELLPSITNFSALYFLIELGLEKLKNNYESIISNYINQPFVINNWSFVNKNDDLLSTELDEYKILSETTEIEYFLKIAKQNLNILINIHTVAETCDLLSLANLNKEEFGKIVHKLLQEYSSKEISENEIFEFETAVHYDLSSIKKNPVSWSLTQLTKSEQGHSMQTIIFKSKESLLPPVLLNNFDLSQHDGEDLYHILELREYVNVI